MLDCLLTANSSVEVVYDGLTSCFRFYGRSNSLDIEVVLALIESLLEANLTLIDYIDGEGDNILHLACRYLESELFVAVVSLLSKKYGDKIRACLRSLNDCGDLPIHYAAQFSTLNVMKLLLELYPESINETDGDERNLLHDLVYDGHQDKAVVNAIVMYLCSRKPEFLLMHDNDGYIPLKCYLCNHRPLDLKTITIMCEVDISIATEKCLNPNDDEKMLPLHLLLKKTFTSNTSVEADCFRYLLHLYPAAAGIENGSDQSPYDIAVRNNMDVYILRILLTADPTIDPESRRYLNWSERREAMFLAFRALSCEPSIWIKMRYESLDLLKHVISYL